MVLADLGKAAAAHAALEKAAEEVAGAPCAFGTDAAAVLRDLKPRLVLALFYGLPEAVTCSTMQRSFAFRRAWRRPLAGSFTKPCCNRRTASPAISRVR